MSVIKVIGTEDARLEIFMVVKIHVMVFWIVPPCNDVVGYQSFGGSSKIDCKVLLEWRWKCPEKDIGLLAMFKEMQSHHRFSEIPPFVLRISVLPKTWQPLHW